MHGILTAHRKPALKFLSLITLHMMPDYQHNCGTEGLGAIKITLYLDIIFDPIIQYC